MESPIKIYYSNGKAYVWNSNDILRLRKNHHIVGSLVGNYPIKPFQIQTKWLPLQLLSEETKLLVEKGIAELIQSQSNSNLPEQIEAYQKQKDKICEEQIVLMKENRKQEILDKADTIYEGKRKKHLQALERKKKVLKTKQSVSPDPSAMELDASNSPKSTFPERHELGTSDHEKETFLECNKESETKPNLEDCELNKTAVIEEELGKVTEVNKEFCMVQLFTENPWKSEEPVPNWSYPSSEKEQIRYAVFKDLWEKKYYITSGAKFGGDFLAYEGDPMKYHALFIVVCKSPKESFKASDLVVYGRLGHQVKKTVALASLTADNTIEYLSLSWEHEVT